MSVMFIVECKMVGLTSDLRRRGERNESAESILLALIENEWKRMNEMRDSRVCLCLPK